MNLSQSQKTLLLRLQYESLPIMDEVNHIADIRVLRKLGCVTKDLSDPFARWSVSDHGTAVLDALELVGKL